MNPRPTETDRANKNSKPDPTDRAKIGFGSGLGRVGFLGLGSGQNRNRTSLLWSFKETSMKSRTVRRNTMEGEDSDAWSISQAEEDLDADKVMSEDE